MPLILGLIDYFKLQFMHRYIIHEVPASFNNMWMRNEERRRQQDIFLRNQEEFYVQPTRLTTTDNFPLALFPRLWNNFSEESIKNIASKTEFNFKLKNFFINELSEDFTCGRLLCPHCHLQQSLQL